MTRSLILSVKPIYAHLIFQGQKSIELRKRIAPRIQNHHVLVYVSSPVQHLQGGFRIGNVWHGEPEEIWAKVSERSFVSKQEFDSYYDGKRVAAALEISDVWEFENPSGLADLRTEFPNFVVPQSWRFVRPEEQRLFAQRRRRKLDAL